MKYHFDILKCRRLVTKQEILLVNFANLKGCRSNLYLAKSLLSSKCDVLICLMLIFIVLPTIFIIW